MVLGDGKSSSQQIQFLMGGLSGLWMAAFSLCPHSVEAELARPLACKLWSDPTMGDVI